MCVGNACTYDAAPGCCKAAKDCDDGDVCTQDTCSNAKCSHTPIGTCCKADADCEDGNICTLDSCNNGSCIQSPAVGCCTDVSMCNDFDSCTEDLCQNSQCIHNPLSGEGCDPSCVKDTYEPNDTHPGKSLGEIDDGDDLFDAPGATAHAPSDIDWYRYHVDDKAFADVQPKVVLTGSSGNAFQVCIYHTCDNGSDSDVDCKSGTADTLNAKTHGCCTTVVGSGEGTVRLGPSCSFQGTGNESGSVDIRVKPYNGTTCGAYTFKWGDS